MTTKTGKYLKYVKEWELHPDLKDWIEPMIDDIKAAYCKVCRKPLHPHKKDLLLHSKAKRHIINLERYKEFYNVSQPLKDANLGDGSYDFHPIDFEAIKKEPLVHPKIKKSPQKKNVTIDVFSEDQEVIQETLDIDKQLEEDDMNETASIVISGEAQIDPESKYAFLKDIPQGRGWLEVNGDNVFCRPCCKYIKPCRVDVVRHFSLKQHQRKCQKLNIIGFETDQETPEALVSKVLNKGLHVIDVRSDSVTQPSKEMKSVMMSATVTDDSIGEDANVRELEEKVSSLLEKENALLVPSGTMANLIAVLTHCWSRDSQLILGEDSDIMRNSQGGLARMGGIHTVTIATEDDGTFLFPRLKSVLDQSQTSPWLIQCLVCIENPCAFVGGRPLPSKWAEDVRTLCQERGALLHMDGSRLLNASLSVGEAPHQLVSGCHSVSFCLDKGLGSPMGCILAGSDEFIQRARRVRGMLGGVIPQAGMFASAALLALHKNAPKLHWDHTNARAIADSVFELHSSAVMVSSDHVRTNFIHLRTDNIRVNAASLCERLAMVKPHEYKTMGYEVKVLALPVTCSTARIVTHYDLSRLDVDLIIQKLKFVIAEYDNMLDLNNFKPVITVRAGRSDVSSPFSLSNFSSLEEVKNL